MAEVHACYTRRWEPLARQQAQALALATAQPITLAPELTPPAPVVALDVTELDFIIAEEDHDVRAYGKVAPSFKVAPTSPGHSFGPAVEELLQRSHRERKASRQVENETLASAVLASLCGRANGFSHWTEKTRIPHSYSSSAQEVSPLRLTGECL
ncbi:UNVERIFIED_CONTAM: hypothetical protein FKN15_072848 [Acipenser sinensis]